MEQTTLYIIFFAAYILIVLSIGIVLSRKETEDGFMIANRKIAGLKVAATMSAGFFDCATLSIYFAYIYMYGFYAIWAFIGLMLGFAIFRRYAKRIKENSRRMKCYTMSEYFYRIYGKRTGIIFSVFIILQFFLLLIVNFIVSSKVLSLMFNIPYSVALIIGGGIVLSYLLLAGFKAVVDTDFFQLMMMFLLVFMTLFIIFGRTATIPLSDFNMVSLGIGNIIGFSIIGIMGVMVGPDIWERVFATKDQKNLKRGLQYGIVIVIILSIIMTVIGLVMKHSLQNVAVEDVFSKGFLLLLPAGISAFAMVLLYAVTLSSADTITFVVSSVMTRDLKNYTKRYSDESMKKMTRIFMIAFIVAGIDIAIFYKNIMNVGFAFASVAVSLFPVVFGTFYFKLKERAVFWSLATALASIVILVCSTTLNPMNTLIGLPVCAVTLIVLQKTLKKNRYKLKNIKGARK